MVLHYLNTVVTGLFQLMRQIGYVGGLLGCCWVGLGRVIMKKLILGILLTLITTNAVTKTHYLNRKEQVCLARAIYHEARGEPLRGQIAVGLVTLNRVKHPSYPNTICGVVYQPHQYSWTKTHKRYQQPDQHSMELARTLILNQHQHLRGFEATHFYVKTKDPRWGLTKVATIGNHNFYKS